MTLLNFIVSYKLCTKCNKEMTIADIGFCKDCKPKREYNRILDKSLGKKYLHKFETKANSCNKGAVESVVISDLKLNSIKFKLNKEIIPTTNLNKTAHFHLCWEKISDFDSFSSFVTKSGQIGITYFAINSFEIQKKPKFQHFIQSKEDKLPNISPSVQILISMPISRPLQFLTQKSYWGDLMKSYFQHIHSIMPLFSINSFNPKTAAKPLLSAIYYGGFLCMKDKPPELISYFNEYSRLNVKEATRVISLHNIQAITIYSFIFVFIGEYALSKYCQSHAIRMSYALGLHLSLNRLTPIQKYDRLKLFSNIFNIHTGTYGINDFTLNQLTEYKDYNIELMGPEYQIPNPNCAFCFDTEDENLVYGVCTDVYSRAYYAISRSLWKVNKYGGNYIQTKFDELFDSITLDYVENMSVYSILSHNYPHLKTKIQSHKFQLLLIYRAINLEVYRILKSKAKMLKHYQISKMIRECSKFFDTVVESKKIIQVTHAYPYIAGLNIINLYPISDSFQRTLIKQKLSEILEFLSSKSCADKLSYLIIKNEYESIIKSEDKFSKIKN